MKLADVLHDYRSSDCSTYFFRPNHGGTDFRGIDLGYNEAGRMTSLFEQEYVAARIAVMKNSMPTTVNDPVDDFRLCVWDLETHELRACTDNLAGLLNALPRGAAFDAIDGGQEIVAPFTDPLGMYEGERAWGGDSFYGVYEARQISIASVNAKKSVMRWPPLLGVNNKYDITQALVAGQRPVGGYVGGVPGPIGHYPSGNYPMMDLLTAEQMEEQYG